MENGCAIRFNNIFRNSEILMPARHVKLVLRQLTTGGTRHISMFLNRRFGRGIAELFMLPYNRKLWGSDLTRLGTDWVAERVAAPDR